MPDIIVNPHAIPSRMTIGQLTECLAFHRWNTHWETGDGTMFRGTSLEFMCDELERHGYDRHGRTTLYNGFTGEAFEARCSWVPPITNVFDTWPPTRITLDPRSRALALASADEGRARNGGVRFGEMERDWYAPHLVLPCFPPR